MSLLGRWGAVLQRLLPGWWAGMLLCVAFIATPAPFATLSSADAGKVVAHIFAHEAPVSLVLAGLLMLLSRAGAATGAGQPQTSRMGWSLLLPAGAAFCTVLGYYGLQPLMADAKAGLGHWTFGQLHAVSLCLFLVKLLLVLALGWRASQPSSAGPSRGG